MQTKPNNAQIQTISLNAEKLGLKYSVTSNFNKTQFHLCFSYKGFDFIYLIMNDGLYANLPVITYQYFMKNRAEIWDLVKKLSSNL